MNIWRVIPITFLLAVGGQVNADYAVAYVSKSIDLISGSIYCNGWEGNDYKDFYVYADFSTINVSGDVCHTGVPNEPMTCDAAQDTLVDFFSVTGTCLYTRHPSSDSAEFMCKGRRSELVRIYYDLCSLMHDIGTQ
jgi:hypothetical protein